MICLPESAARMSCLKLQVFRVMSLCNTPAGHLMRYLTAWICKSLSVMQTKGCHNA